MDIEKKPGELGDGRITEEGLAKLRSLIGVKMHIGGQFNDLASRTAIRNFVNGVGDSNPLYRDPEYAKKTRYGRLIAPPSWAYSVFPTWVSVGLPGVHGFHSGNDWTFYEPVFEGDVITPECIYEGYDEKKGSRFAGRTIINRQEARYYNQKGDLVSRAKSWSVRAERHRTREKGKYSNLQLPHPYTQEELRKIEEEVLDEEIRGSKVRYWEDVKVGDELKPLAKGVLGVTDMIAYIVGAAPMQFAAHGVQLRTYRKHPAWCYRDPTTNALEPIVSVHYNLMAAKNAGLPFMYDGGCQRNSWGIQFMTNWMGDEGWLKKCYAKYTKFVYLSDAVRLTGKVIRKFIDEDGEYCVEVETHAVNQRNEDTMPGQYVAALPSRKAGIWPVARRLG
jgi:acyl dehydratase